MTEEDKEKQEKIDELYQKVWALIDTIDNLKTEALEIGEEMKEIVSKEVFK